VVLEEQLRPLERQLERQLEHQLEHQQRRLGSQQEQPWRKRHKLERRLELERSTKEHPSNRRNHGHDDDVDDYACGHDSRRNRRHNQEQPSNRIRHNRDQQQQRCRCRSSRYQQLRPRSQYQQKKHDS